MKNPGRFKGGRALLLTLSLCACHQLAGQISQCVVVDSSGSVINPPGILPADCGETINYVVDQENLSHHP